MGQAIKAFTNTDLNTKIDIITKKMVDTTVVVPANKWTGSTAPYTNVVSVPGITSDTNPLYALVPKAGESSVSNPEIAAYNAVFTMLVENDKITLTAKSKPAVDFTILLKCALLAETTVPQEV